MLASNKWITYEARDELTAAYQFLRRVEHRLQMIADEQTHSLQGKLRGCGKKKYPSFLRLRPPALPSPNDLLRHLNIVQGHYSKLFEDDPTGTAKLPAVDYGGGSEDPRLLEASDRRSDSRNRSVPSPKLCGFG